jgi:hypothetical protein
MARDESWRIGHRGGACSACAEPLRPGSEAVSAIYAAGDVFERRDFCGACFQAPEKRATPFSWWSAVVPEPEKKKAVFDLGVAKEFLQRLLRDQDPSRDSLRYLLALMLMRKRGVVLVGQNQTDAGEVMVVRVPPDDETVHELKVVDLDEAETERLREELGKLFQL